MVNTVTQHGGGINFGKGQIFPHIRGELDMHIADLGDNHGMGRGLSPRPLFVVGDKGGKGDIELVPAVEESQLNQTGRAFDLRPHLTEQVDTGGHGAPGGQKVVKDNDFLPGFDTVGLHLDGAGPVFEVIGIGNDLPGKLPLFAHHDETAAQFKRQRRGHEKATGFDPGQDIGAVLPHRGRHPPHGYPPSVRMGEQGGNVVEQNSRLGKIGNRADMVFQVHMREIPLVLKGLTCLCGFMVAPGRLPGNFRKSGELRKNRGNGEPERRSFAVCAGIGQALRRFFGKRDPL
uniref:Uncharacterized protein n=1 Tax=uncultured marine microorganism HF4000_APKG8K5 TaxID=455555 RepID=B3TB34_9ZZZZ|nr:hypothetical protein ALOHA_HF4000APKG8K5ctg1g12 [uncultured marine microorganism HF4000_APKG8K5]